MTSATYEAISSTGGSANVTYFERDVVPLRTSWRFCHALRPTRNCVDAEDLPQETVVERGCAPPHSGTASQTALSA